MRAVVQRVSRAEVRVGGERASQLERGLLALVGVERGDAERDALWLAEKLVHLRVFPDAPEPGAAPASAPSGGGGRMNRSLLEVGCGLAVVSQFTLLGDCRRGRRPSYDAAERPEAAERWIERLCARARELGAPVVTGVFRAQMEVELVGDGPVTLLLDSRQVF